MIPSFERVSKQRSGTNAKRGHRWGLGWAAVLLAASSAGCGGTGDETVLDVDADVVARLVTPEATGELRQGLGTILIVAEVKTPNGVAAPGVQVELMGTSQATRTTDANGRVRFDVPAGAYTLRPRSGSGRSFSPDVINLNDGASTFRSFSCTGCNGSTTVSASKSILITDPSVTTDGRAENTNAGPWSFRFMLEQMAPAGTDPADFVRAWLDEFVVHDSFNGFQVEVRDLDFLLSLWPTTPEGKLDLARAPFRLLAIANRTDLHPSSNGEARFVYGLVDADGVGQRMTVIFEFGLPTSDPITGAALSRKRWIDDFHALRTSAFGAGYNARLQALTDRITRRGSSPSSPGGSAINQVRTNEIATGPVWQAREFHLVNSGGGLALSLAAPAMTPADIHSVDDTPEHQRLADYINANAVAIQGGYASVPSGMLGGQSTESFLWDFAQPVDEPARAAFAAQTCSGCHAVETSNLQIDAFYHVSPVADGGSDGTGRLSDFVKLFEIPRRTAFMQNQLSCSGASCAAAAETVFF